MNTCLCNLDQIADTFKCTNCGKHHHWKCYDYTLADKQPTTMRCLQCTLNAYDPFNYTIQLLPTQDKKKAYFFGKKYICNQKILHFDLADNFEKVKSKQYQVAVVCTRLKDKKLYEWPSQNIYIELNNVHHIRYTKYGYADISSSLFNQSHNQIMVNLVDPLEDLAVLSIVLIKQQSVAEIKATITDSLSDRQIGANRQEYIKKIKAIQQNQQDDIALINDQITLKLIDGMTLGQLRYPVRGKICSHLDCFDLDTYLELNHKPMSVRWKCPNCTLIVPTDQLMLDTVVLQLLHMLQIRYPLFCSEIKKVAILNKDLDYQILEPQEIAEKQKAISELKEKSKVLGYTCKLRMQNIRLNAIPRIIEIINEFRRKENNTQITPTLKYYNCRKFLKILYKRNLLDQFRHNHIQIREFITNIVDFSAYFAHNVFEDPHYLNQLVGFELICKEVSEYTLSGLVVHYISLFNKSIQDVSELLILFAYNPDVKEVSYFKLLELSLAYSYQERKESPGFYFQGLLHCFYSGRLVEVMRVLHVLRYYFSNIYYTDTTSQLLFIKNSQCVADLIMNIPLTSVKELYPLEILNDQTTHKIQLMLILHFWQIKKYKHQHKLSDLGGGEISRIKSEFVNTLNQFDEYKLKPYMEQFGQYLWKDNNYTYIKQY